MINFQKTGIQWLREAGIQVNGNDPWDIQVKNDALFDRILRSGSLGLGEAYMEGWWEVDDMPEFFNRLFNANIDKKAKRNPVTVLNFLKARVFNVQKRSRAFDIGRAHYDVGNNLYEKMLDNRMTYTCGYWKNVKTLDEAQEAKLDLVCKKIGLKKGDTVLDIGCGWGSFMIYAAEKYGVECVGVTVSKEQIELGKKKAKGLPVKLLYQDYRDVKGTFDHIVSLGMFEHVGYKNYRNFMKVVSEHLKDDGLFLLHTIGGLRSVRSTDAWIEKYIFPNSMLPSQAQITDAADGLFVMEDWHNFGYYYYLTLMEWYKNFNKAWPELKKEYNDIFYRMWRYYLMASAGTFKSRKNQLWQVVYSKRGVPGGYVSVR